MPYLSIFLHDDIIDALSFYIKRSTFQQFVRFEFNKGRFLGSLSHPVISGIPLENLIQ